MATHSNCQHHPGSNLLRSVRTPRGRSGLPWAAMKSAKQSSPTEGRNDETLHEIQEMFWHRPSHHRLKVWLGQCATNRERQRTCWKYWWIMQQSMQMTMRGFEDETHEDARVASQLLRVHTQTRNPPTHVYMGTVCGTWSSYSQPIPNRGGGYPIPYPSPATPHNHFQSLTKIGSWI